MLPREIELKALYITITRNGKRASFPVIKADLNYQVNAFPAVQVVISSAGVFNGDDSGDDIKDLFEDSPEGSQGVLWLKASNPRYGEVELPLFTGYISGSGANLLVNLISVQSNITFQLVCSAAAMNAIPGNGFTYFSVGGGNNMLTPKPYTSYLAERNDNVWQKNLMKMEKTFETNPAKAVIQLIDALRGTAARDTGTPTSITAESSFDTSQVALKIIPKDQQAKQVLDNFGREFTLQLATNPAASVITNALNTLMLSMVPETISPTSADGSKTSICKMIVRPGVSGWEPEAAVELTSSDLLGITDTVGYRLDQRVDFWYVQVGAGEEHASTPFAAVYAPGYGKNGEALYLDMGALLKAVTNTLKTDGKTRYLVGRGVTLPKWLYLLGDRYRAAKPAASSTKSAKAPSQSTSTNAGKPQDTSAKAAKQRKQGKAGSTPVEAPAVKTVTTNTTEVEGGGTEIGEVQSDEALELWEDFCKRLAVLSFLQNGCMVNSVNLKLPLYTAFRLLPWLGNTISFSAPSPQDTTNNLELKAFGTTKYGLLSGISLSFECGHKEIQVFCSATLSQVHDEELHEKMSADNTLYEASEDGCYNPSALEQLYNLV